MNHIYCFYDKEGNLLYVGKTTNLPNRMSAHFSTPIMEKEPWKELVDLENIVLYKCATRTDLDIYETYFISKLKPLYNKDKLFYDLPTFELPNIKPTIFIYSPYKRTSKELGMKFEERMVKLKEIHTSQKTEDLKNIQVILSQYLWLKTLISKIGYEKSFELFEQEKFNTTNIKRKGISFQDSNEHEEVKKKLLTYPDIYIGAFVTSVKAKEIIKEIYLAMNIEKTPKGSDLKSYFNCRDYKKRDKDKIINGFIIQE